MAQQILPSNTFTVAKWIVSPTASNGTHTTIASALASSSSGDTIFIRPGTYTENPTGKAGVTLAAFPGLSTDTTAPNVIIKGKVTMTGAGDYNFDGVGFSSNSDNCISVTGSSAVIVNCLNCVFIPNGTDIAINLANSNCQLQAYSCTCQGAGTLYTISGTAGTGFFGCNLSQAGTISAGTITFYNSVVAGSHTTTSTGSVQGFNSYFNTSNATILTTAGTGGGTFYNSEFVSGSASAISVGAGTTVNVFSSAIGSSNTNAITGAGTISYSGVTFTGGSSTINTTTTTPLALTVFQGGTGLTGTTVNQILYSSAANTIAGLATANSAVLATNGSGVPSITATPTVTSITFGSGSALNTYVQATSWTPAISIGGSTTGITYTTQTGEYTQIGNIIFFTFNILLSSKGSQTGSVLLTGWPVSSSGSGGVFPIPYVVSCSLTAGDPILQGVMNGSTANVWMGAATGSGVTALSNTQIANTTQLQASGFYFIS